MKTIIVLALLFAISIPSFAQIGLSYGSLDNGLYLDLCLPTEDDRRIGIVVPTRNRAGALRYTRTYLSRGCYWTHGLYPTKSHNRFFYATAFGFFNELEIPKSQGLRFRYGTEMGVRTAPLYPVVDFRIGFIKKF